MSRNRLALDDEPLSTAVRRAVDAVAGLQASDGEVASVVATQVDMGGVRAPDTNYFTTSQILWSLRSLTDETSANIRNAGADFVVTGEQDGSWRFFTNKVRRSIDADCDCTGAAAAALSSLSLEVPSEDIRAVLAAHRDDDGRFLTWFRDGKPNDVDSVANANVLWFLQGDALGDAAALWLASLINDGEEVGTFPYYETPLALFHAVSRAFANGTHKLGGCVETLVKRVRALQQADRSFGNALETSFALVSLLNAGTLPDAGSIDALLAMQTDDGAWPDCAAWNGPEWPAPRSMWWGGAAWTTAIAIEAIERYRVHRSPALLS